VVETFAPFVAKRFVYFAVDLLSPLPSSLRFAVTSRGLDFSSFSQGGARFTSLVLGYFLSGFQP
jgi:hypothetical protein